MYIFMKEGMQEYEAAFQSDSTYFHLQAKSGLKFTD